MMKYKGKKLEGRNTDVLVLYRGSERIVIKAQAIKDYKEFEKLCQPPEPPVLHRPGGVKEPDVNNPDFLKALDEYATKKTNYSIIKSLEITEDLEWETIDLKKPETFANWGPELEEAGFTEIERLHIMRLCVRVNALDEDLLDQAKEAFLVEARQQEK